LSRDEIRAAVQALLDGLPPVVSEKVADEILVA
jgi:hypothetical protein